MKIAVLAAMEMEFKAFEILLENKEDLSEGSFHLVKGMISNTEIYLLQTYIYKTYAAITTTKFLEKYDVDLVINIGTEGSLDKNVHVNDVVIATKVAFHDVIDPYYYQNGWVHFVKDNAHYGAFDCDPKYVEIAKKIKTDIPFHVGPMVSGDDFIDIDIARGILKNFPGALCGENEAGGVAQTCYFYNVPFIVLRAISDITVEHDNIEMFNNNVYSTSDVSALFTKQFILQCEKEDQ